VSRTVRMVCSSAWSVSVWSSTSICMEAESKVGQRPGAGARPRAIRPGLRRGFGQAGGSPGSW
jgi:hypothetical protein